MGAPPSSSYRLRALIPCLRCFNAECAVRISFCKTVLMILLFAAHVFRLHYLPGPRLCRECSAPFIFWSTHEYWCNLARVPEKACLLHTNNSVGSFNVCVRPSVRSPPAQTAQPIILKSSEINGTDSATVPHWSFIKSGQPKKVELRFHDCCNSMFFTILQFMPCLNMELYLDHTFLKHL